LRRYNEGEVMSPEQFDAVTHEVSTAAMKYALLSVGCLTQINFDIAKITDFEDASAPFILYNSTRVASVVRKFEDKVGRCRLHPVFASTESDVFRLRSLTQCRFVILRDLTTCYSVMECAWFQRLILQCDEPLANFAFSLNLRLYDAVEAGAVPALPPLEAMDLAELDHGRALQLHTIKTRVERAYGLSV
jgi:hypothetical protein